VCVVKGRHHQRRNWLNAKLQMIQSLKKEFEKSVGGEIVFKNILRQVLLWHYPVMWRCYFLFIRKKIISSDLQLSFLLAVSNCAVCASAEVSLSIDVMLALLVPFCMLPIIVRTFFRYSDCLFTSFSDDSNCPDLLPQTL